MTRNSSFVKATVVAALTLMLACAAFVLVKGYFGGCFDSADTLREYIGGFGIFAPAALVVIQALQVVLPVLPSALGYAAGAGLFGTVGGFLCNYIGISVGSIAAFLLARRYGSGLVRRMVSVEKHQKFVEWVNTKNSYSLVLFLSILLPLAPDDFLCYFSGLSEMSVKKFVWIIVLAKPWCILFYSVFFSYFL